MRLMPRGGLAQAAEVTSVGSRPTWLQARPSIPPACVARPVAILWRESQLLWRPTAELHRCHVPVPGRNLGREQ